MQHLDEHTLAFYAMGAEFPSTEKDAIEAHLSECHGCRAQVDELRGIDQEVAETMDSAASSQDLPSDALVTLPRAIRRRSDAPPVRLGSRILAPTTRFAALVRRHPVGAGSAALMFAFLSFFAIRGVFDRFSSPIQPAFVQWNPLETALDVYGKDNQKLWDIPVCLTGKIDKTLELYRDQCTRIADLDGDGNMEVVTGVPFFEEEKEVINVLRILDNKGHPISRTPLGSAVNFKGTPYSNFFGVSGVLIIPGADSGKKEIAVGVNNDRSPYCLIRLDYTGKILGEYWHIGWLNQPRRVQLQGEDRDLILLSGVNDAMYQADSVYPAIAVLDVSKIVGRSESAQSRGFGFEPSRAEVYYIKCGNPDPARCKGIPIKHASFYYSVKTAPDSSFSATELFSVPPGFPGIVYTFDNRLNVRDVWLTDEGRMVLKADFLTKKTPAGVQELLEDLKNKVRYWDGRQWRKKPTMIVGNASLSKGR
jgi:hypothetical protein